MKSLEFLKESKKYIFRQGLFKAETEAKQNKPGDMQLN